MVFKTLREMLNDRGYLVPPSELNMTEDEFKNTYGELPSYVFAQHVIELSMA